MESFTMAWKKEYAEKRKQKAASDPDYRAKRNAQSAKDKEARAEYMKEYYAKNPEKFKKRTPEQQAQYNARRREKYAECAETREKAKAAARLWAQSNPDGKKAQRLAAAYGIALSDFNDMMAMQNNACAICGYSDMSDPKIFPVVDHCHTTGKVRGILCSSCNHGLGKFKDDVTRLMLAAAYLSRNG